MRPGILSPDYKPRFVPKAVLAWRAMAEARTAHRRAQGEETLRCVAARKAALIAKQEARAAKETSRLAEIELRRLVRLARREEKKRLAALRPKRVSTPEHTLRFDGKLPPVGVAETPDVYKLILAAVKNRDNLYKSNADDITSETFIAFMEGRVRLEDIPAIIKLQHQRQLRDAGAYGANRGVTVSIDDAFDDGTPKFLGTKL